MPDVGATTACPWIGLQPRRWQLDALPLVLGAIRRRERSVVAAVMGSGKSILQAEVCAAGTGRVVVTVPTVRLVDQLADTIERRCPGAVGRYYTHAKEADRRITVCCLPSLPALLSDSAWPGPPALWIADEAHRTECATVLGAYAALAPTRAVAFTATPFRAEETEELSLWDRLAYEYTAQDAIRDGVVVPWRPVYWDGPEIVGQSGLDAACTQMIRVAVPVGAGLVNAKSIADAEAYAAALTAAGIAAAAVHSRLPRAAVTGTMDRLRSGELACVVHVNMLSEGVDYPWLRWLCLRRQVGSRVRFCQEVGRVLRSAAGKTEALLLDPIDLLGAHGMSYAEVLAGMGRPATAHPMDEDIEADDAEEADDMPPAMARERYAVRLARWRRYVRMLWAAASVAGLVEIKIKSRSWRPNPASEKQVATIRYAISGLARDTSVPPPHRRRLAVVAEHAEDLRRGELSDLLSVLFALRDDRRRRRSMAPGAASGWDLMRAALESEAAEADE